MVMSRATGKLDQETPLQPVPSTSPTRIGERPFALYRATAVVPSHPRSMPIRSDVPGVTFSESSQVTARKAWVATSAGMRLNPILPPAYAGDRACRSCETFRTPMTLVFANRTHVQSDVDSTRAWTVTVRVEAASTGGTTTGSATTSTAAPASARSCTPRRIVVLSLPPLRAARERSTPSVQPEAPTVCFPRDRAIMRSALSALQSPATTGLRAANSFVSATAARAAAPPASACRWEG